MRVRILRRPTGTIAGVSLDQLHVGRVYELRTQVACVVLAEGWAEVVADNHDAATLVRPSPDHVAHIKALVLVVDHESDVRRVTEQLLASPDYDVTIVRHGEEAIELLCQHHPNVIVIDLNRDGWHLRAEHVYLTDKKLAAVPVLLRNLASGAGDQTATIQAVGIIRKPFDPHTVLSIVRAATPSQMPHRDERPVSPTRQHSATANDANARHRSTRPPK